MFLLDINLISLYVATIFLFVGRGLPTDAPIYLTLGEVS